MYILLLIQIHDNFWWVLGYHDEIVLLPAADFLLGKSQNIPPQADFFWKMAVFAGFCANFGQFLWNFSLKSTQGTFRISQFHPPTQKGTFGHMCRSKSTRPPLLRGWFLYVI